MNPDKAIDATLNVVKNGTSGVSNMYSGYIRKKAVDSVNEKISLAGIDINIIDPMEYEIMVDEASKEIKKDHALTAVKGLAAIIGIDFLLGF